MNDPSKGIYELFGRVEKEWNNIPKEVLQNTRVVIPSTKILDFVPFALYATKLFE